MNLFDTINFLKNKDNDEIVLFYMKNVFEDIFNLEIKDVKKEGLDDLDSNLCIYKCKTHKDKDYEIIFEVDFDESNTDSMEEKFNFSIISIKYLPTNEILNTNSLYAFKTNIDYIDFKKQYIDIDFYTNHILFEHLKDYTLRYYKNLLNELKDDVYLFFYNEKLSLSFEKDIPFLNIDSIGFNLYDREDFLKIEKVLLFYKNLSNHKLIINNQNIYSKLESLSNTLNYKIINLDNEFIINDSFLFKDLLIGDANKHSLMKINICLNSFNVNVLYLFENKNFTFNDIDSLFDFINKLNYKIK